MLTLNTVVQTQMMLKLSGRPNSAVVLKNIKKLHKLVLANHKFKISEGSVLTILHEHLSMRKLCLKWLLHLLTVNQKQQCVDNSEHCLQLFQRNKKEFCVDMWWWMKHGSSTSLSNRPSAEWTAAGESYPKWPKTQTSAGKILASVFWDAQGILFIDYLEKKRTINREYYIALLVCLKEEITKKCPQMKKVLSPRQCHKLIVMMAKLQELQSPTLYNGDSSK